MKIKGVHEDGELSYQRRVHVRVCEASDLPDDYDTLSEEEKAKTKRHVKDAKDMVTTDKKG